MVAKTVNPAYKFELKSNVMFKALFKYENEYNSAIRFQ